MNIKHKSSPQTSLPRDLVFLHVPKTAGTATRNAMQKALKSHHRLFDYGPVEKTTSQEIAAYRYTNGISEKPLRSFVNNDRPVFLSGHFSAIEYIGEFASESFITFLREPIARVVSEYKHFSRHMHYKGSLLDFAEIPQFRNRQTHFLRGLPLEKAGFVGLSEEMEASVTALSARLGVKLNVARENVAPASQKVELDAKTKIHLEKLNLLDLQLYQRAREMFYEKQGMSKIRNPDYQGSVVRLEDGSLQGWIVHESGFNLVTLPMRYKDRKIQDIKADRFRHDLKTLGISVNGICGFHVPANQLPDSIASVVLDLTEPALLIS